MANSKLKTRSYENSDTGGFWKGFGSTFNPLYGGSSIGMVSGPTNTGILSKEQYDTFQKKLESIANATIKKGSKLTDSELKDIIGEENWAWYRDDNFDELYNQFVSDNYDMLLGDEAQRNYKHQDTEWAVKAWSDAMAAAGAGNQQIEIPTAGTLGADYQAMLDAQNQASDIAYQTAMDELARSENEMYRTLGMTQRQMERDIAKRRQQALKSGMSTAQLAAQEQQNLLAAQTGATQIAQQYADQRYSTINQFAGAHAQNYANALQQQIGWNQQAIMANQNANNTWANTMANAYAQIYASDANLKALEKS